MNQLVVDAIEFIKTISEEELDFIAKSDYGQEVERHKTALKKLIFEQNGVVQQEQFWYPYEVVELCKNVCQKGHTREFLICHMIIAISIIEGSDGSNEPESMMYNIPNGNQLSDKEFEFITELLMLADKKYHDINIKY